MPFLDHLEELRRRLFYSAVAVLIGAIIAYILFTQVPGFDPIEFLARPATEALRGQKLIYTGTTDLFKMQINVGFVLAMIIASPVISYQLWGFVAPAMYANEKRIVIPVIFAAVSLFIMGIVMCYVVILPLTMKFFMGFETQAAVPMLTMRDFITLEIYMCLGFGLAFQLPIVVLLLSAIGLVTPQMMKKVRRFAIVGVLIVSAAITPDPTTMILMWIPLYALYEISIWLSAMVHRWREKRDLEGDYDEDDEEIPASSRGEPLRLDQLE